VLACREKDEDLMSCTMLENSSLEVSVVFLSGTLYTLVDYYSYIYTLSAFDDDDDDKALKRFLWETSS